jgi:sigma-E factor negative regulatory protein RseA
MNERISALMDGELNRDDAATLIKSLSSDQGRRNCWDEYHLIRDAVNGENVEQINARRARCDAIFARLADEPTILAPTAMKRRATEKRTRIALAMAASAVTVSAIAVVAMKQQQSVGVVPTTQLVQQTAPRPLVLNASTQSAQQGAAEMRVNDYLAIHRQFSNADAFQNAALRREAAR